MNIDKQPNEIKCFVIIGYGPKTSYADGKVRTLNLDETYEDLILPVFKSLGIECYRAIDKNLTGSIDKAMLHDIKDADIALVDISTLNANVMWELGVRHALKPHHTIMICERKQTKELPFDINHFPIHEYVHTEEGIPHREIDRFRSHLTRVVQGILNQEPKEIDSPVHTFLNDELEEKAESADSFATTIGLAEKAKSAKKYDKALEYFEKAKMVAKESMILMENLPFIITRQALCTYKSHEPSRQKDLIEAQNILSELDPFESQDIEVLGLSGAIDKRLFELTSDTTYLDSAIYFYEKGFRMKRDYYNGINAAFMLYQKVGTLKPGEEREDVKTDADSIRNQVLKIVLEFEQRSDFLESKDAIWVLFTAAEAYRYKNQKEKWLEYEEKAVALANKNNDAFAIGSYQEQKEKITTILML